MTPWLARRWALKCGSATVAAWALPANASALPERPLQFPRDHGAHPEFKTEWWYITGYANTASGEAVLGFQLTFFRSRVDATQGMTSRLAARQLLFAHAAVTDVAGKKLWHDQRIARWSGEPPRRNPADVASASTDNTRLNLRDWSLHNAGDGLQAVIPAEKFSLQLQFQPTQPVLLQGKNGVSRKGPEEKQASYYYSQPQLQAQGSIALQGRTLQLLAGSKAWMDHEWSQEILPAQAVGWDWLGINLFDGSALTAFQLRTGEGQVLWDGGSFRSGSGVRYAFSRGEVLFRALRQWRSPSSQASYPVEWIVRTPADYYTVNAVVDNQELDSRSSTGAIYWEGLCEVRDSNSRLVGRGYLEMTGYASPLKM